MALAFTLVGTRSLPVRGASGVTPSKAGLLVVEDDLGLFVVRGRRATLWAGPALHPALGDLEGVAANTQGDVVWAIAEEDGTLVEMKVTRSGPRVRRVSRLPRPGTRANKGFEGLAFLPAHLSPSKRAALVAVHEGRPRRVCVFALPDLQETHALKLSRAAKAALGDLADVAVDPVTGALILLSEQSRRLAVVALDGVHLEVDSLYDLPLDGRERPEGLAFLRRDCLAVVTEGPARMLELRVSRSRRTRV